MKSPCHECTERRLGCHARCEDYKIYAAYREDVRKRHKVENDGRSAALSEYRRRYAKYLREKKR